MGVPASASELDTAEGAVPIVLLPDDTDLGGDLIVPYGLNLPTENHNLRISDYAVRLIEVGSGRLYTKESLNKSSAAGQRIFFASHAE